MSSNRRDAVRVTLNVPGMLRFGRKRVECTVLDASALGMRVTVDPPQLVPDRLILRTVIAGHEVEVRAWVRRAEPGLTLALEYEDAENSQLHRLIADAQRLELAERFSQSERGVSPGRPG